MSLDSILKAPTRAMHWIVGNYYKPKELMKVRMNLVCVPDDYLIFQLALFNFFPLFLQKLKKGGIDVCPSFDAAFYIENIDSKHYVVETSIYEVFGLFCQSFRFKRSKFNQVAGKMNIVFQAQEIYPDHQVREYKFGFFSLLSTDASF